MDFDTYRAYRKTTFSSIFWGNVYGFRISTIEFRVMAVQHET
jgi:hypothetical protein